MSHTITRSVTLHSTLTISWDTAQHWKGKLPQFHPLTELEWPPVRCANGHEALGPFCQECGTKVGPRVANIFRFQWSGACSNDDALLAAFASDLQGNADVLRIWEGDRVDAIRIRSGKVTKHVIVVSPEGLPVGDPAYHSILD